MSDLSLLTFNLAGTLTGDLIATADVNTFVQLAAPFTYPRNYAILGFTLSSTIYNVDAAQVAAVGLVINGNGPTYIIGSSSNNALALQYAARNVDAASNFYAPNSQVTSFMFPDNTGVKIDVGMPITLVASCSNQANSRIAAAIVLYAILVK